MHSQQAPNHARAVQYKGETKKFKAEEISSMVLLKMKETAQVSLGRTDNTMA